MGRAGAVLPDGWDTDLGEEGMPPLSCLQLPRRRMNIAVTANIYLRATGSEAVVPESGGDIPRVTLAVSDRHKPPDTSPMFFCSLPFLLDTRLCCL